MATRDGLVDLLVRCIHLAVRGLDAARAFEERGPDTASRALLLNELEADLRCEVEDLEEELRKQDVRVGKDLKERLDVLLDRSGRTLTAVVRRFIERLVTAWEATPGEPASEELILFLTAAQFAAAVNRAEGE